MPGLATIVPELGHRSGCVCRVACLLMGALAFAAPALAQDSTSRNLDGGNGLPGDALSPFLTNFTRTNYVVDLAPLRTSWGTTFGIAPILKSGKTSVARFNAINGPSTISQTIRTGVGFPSGTYTSWTSPTAGVSTSQNNTGLNTTQTPTGSASVFGVAFLDVEDIVAGGLPTFVNQIVGGLVAFDPATPSRVYVSRIVGANNSASAATDRSQFGLGGVDSHGNVTFRGDSVNSASSASLIPGDNYFRVRLAQRSSAVNSIDGAGAVDAGATAWLLNNAPVTHAVPNLIPESIAGRPVLIGSNFVGQLTSETSPGTITSVATHRPSTTDHRGSVAHSPKALFAGSTSTGATLARSAPTGLRTDAISVFGLDNAGNVTTARTFAIPLTLQDACDSTLWPLGSGEFRHYDSQVLFRGGTSQVSVGKDQTGRGLLAATLSSGNSGANNPFNAIAVCRFDPSVPGSVGSWSIAAWTNTSNTDGKDILGDFGQDGAPGTNDAGENDGAIDGLDAPIGRLASLSELGTGKVGPSLSAPAFDSVGNLYFMASVALKKSMGASVVQVFTQGLIRGVYDPATSCFKLELVLELNSVFQGANSNTRYMVNFLGLADSDSISSSSLWSSSVSQASWNNVDVAGVETGSALTLGGLVLSARIVYDTNNDSLFQDPTALAGNAASVDEAYNAILLIANTTPPATCIADVDDGTFTGTPDGGVTIDDLLYYLSIFEQGTPEADVDDGSFTGTPDGGVTIDDLLYYLFRFESGC